MDALHGKQISGAGIDVTVPEPPAADHPLMSVLNLPNFILTPHVAWASAEAVQSLTNQLFDNVEAFVKGSPRNVLAGKSKAEASEPQANENTATGQTA